MQIPNITEYKKTIQYDGSLRIATGKSRLEKNWKNKSISWSALLHKLETPVKTAETHAEYARMGKLDQDRIKDIGGFVGGTLRGGRRKADAVEGRQLITLDADFAPVGMLDDLNIFFDYAYAVYSTHKHTPEKPRLRLLIPLDREVTPDEYEAIARKLAEEIGIEYFDDTTYQPSRLMYWGSVSADGEYIFTYEDLPWLKADQVLEQYADWTDTSYWPESSRAKERRVRLAKRQGDPTEKDGLIGAFCRTYSVEEAIETFLPEVYAKCGMEGRYTFVEGSTAAGLVLYDNGKFAYSNHATDPVSGKLCNAFDLVRIHKFGELDDAVSPDTTTAKRPSFRAMIGLVQKDDQTKLELARERVEKAKDDFAEDADEVNWVIKLTYHKGGGLETSLNNLNCIMRHDPSLKGIVFNQMADNLEVKGDVPWRNADTSEKFWRDADDAQLESFLAANYQEFPKNKIMTAITKAGDDRSYHPVREYLDSLPAWDGIPRVDTLLIDYLGAEDNGYVRAVTRKTLCAAVHRVRYPGCKFDTMLVLNGPQGVGKSTLVHKLGGEWYSDSLSLSDTRDKTAAEKLQGNWLIEIGELAGLRKMDVETLKSFLSRQNDEYRASYGRRTMPHPRQSIFIGTTNAEDGFLRDITGGRRFWPVLVPGNGTKRIWDITQEEINQIWAEVLILADNEKLYLDKETEEMAKDAQREAMESDEREGIIQEYLNRKLPEKWNEYNLYRRRSYLHGSEFDEEDSEIEEGSVTRESVCIAEIWCECLEREIIQLKRMDSYEIAAIMAKFKGWKKETKSKWFGKMYGSRKYYSRT